MAVPPLAPGERPRALVKPAVLRRHLPRTDEAVAERADHADHERIDEIVMQGQERPIEEREVDEAHRPGQKEKVEHALPIWPQGERDRAPRHPGRPAAHEAGDEEEEPDRRFFVEDALHQRRPPSRSAALTSGLAKSSRPLPESVIAPLTMT